MVSRHDFRASWKIESANINTSENLREYRLQLKITELRGSDHVFVLSRYSL